MTQQEQIPVWSYINFQLLYQLQLAQKNNCLKTMTVFELLERTDQHVGSKPGLLEYYDPINSGSVFSLLYALLVVPKELFSSGDPKFFEDFNFSNAEYFEPLLGEKRIDIKIRFFRILRNAIAHVNYKIDEENKFDVEIWNTDKKGNKNVLLKTDIQKLGAFAISFAHYYNDKRIIGLSKY